MSLGYWSPDMKEWNWNIRANILANRHAASRPLQISLGPTIGHSTNHFQQMKNLKKRTHKKLRITLRTKRSTYFKHLPDLVFSSNLHLFSVSPASILYDTILILQVQGMHSDIVTLRKASIWHEASRIVREEGFRAFWKGNLVTIAHRLPYSSISFYAFERYKNVGTYVLWWFSSWS